ncbi:MAG: hypothetical protein K8R85_16680, partial [Bacteroidetes bacterium]|nr:hypothetical protein [Bacteroidota bacterium]
IASAAKPARLCHSGGQSASAQVKNKSVIARSDDTKRQNDAAICLSVEKIKETYHYSKGAPFENISANTTISNNRLIRRRR